MSIQYYREIHSIGDLTLQVNFSGIKNGIKNKADLRMSFYVFDKTGTPKFSETLDYNEIKNLYDHLNQISIIRNAEITSTGKFIEATEDLLDLFGKLKTIDLSILKIILDKFKDKEKIEALLSSLTEIEIDDLFIFQKRTEWKFELDNLEKLLELEEKGNVVLRIKGIKELQSYEAGQPEKIFQNWIEKNPLWIFGIEYLKKYDVRKIAMFSEGDLLM